MILQGPVASVYPAVGFIVIRHGAGRNAEEIPIEIDNKTTFMRAGQRLSIDQVRAGERVKVTYAGSPGDVTKTIDVTGGPSTRARARRAPGRSMPSGRSM
jgi:hypothetical protein